MRNRQELSAAFDLLERVADAHLDDVAALRPAATPEHRPNAPRRALLGSLAAASVIGLGVGAVAVFDRTPNAQRDTGPGTQQGTTSPTTSPVDPRRLGFGLDPSAGFTFDSAFASSTGEQWTYVHCAHGWVGIEVDPPSGVDRRIAPEADTVDVNGVSAYYGDGFGLTYTIGAPSSATPSVATPPPSSAAPDAPGERGVAWRYAPRAWVVVTSHENALDKTRLLALARAVDLSATTTVRLPFTMNAVPRGMHVESVSANYQPGGTGAVPGGQVVLRDDADASGVDIYAVQSSDAPGGSGIERLTVSGHHAYWDQANQSLDVMVRPDLDLEITAAYVDGATSLSRDAALAAAELVGKTADPHEPQTWFDASTAVPG